MSIFGQSKYAKRGKSTVLNPLPRQGARAAVRPGHFMVLAAFVILVAAMTRESGRQPLNIDDIDERVRLGEDIVAPFFFESEDIGKSEEARAAAAAAVPDYYRVDPRKVEERVTALGKRIGQLRAWRPAVERAVLDGLLQSTSAEEAEAVMDAAAAAVAQEAAASAEWRGQAEAAALAPWLRPDAASLPQRVFAPQSGEGGAPENAPRAVIELTGERETGIVFSYGDRLSELARITLRHLLEQGVRFGAANSDSEAQLLRAVSTSTGASQPKEMLLSELPDWDQVLEIHNQWLRDEARLRVLDTEDASAWAKLLDNALIMAHLEAADVIRPDQDAAISARQRAREAVEPVMRDIEADIILQQKNRYWTAQSRSDVRTLAASLESTARPRQRTALLVLANFILVAMVIAFIYRAVYLLTDRSKVPPSTQFNLALLLTCCVLAAGRAIYYFESTGFLLPAAAAAILMAILVSARLAVILGLSNAVLISALYGYDWRVLLLTLTMSIAGALSIHKVRRRSDMAGASLNAACAGLLAVTVLALALESGFSEEFLRGLLLVAMNGAICLLIVPGLLSPLERLFHITTDIQMLEYSDLNNELLGQLAIKAPGTFAHSLMLGQLAEAAADAIGANGLLARVCAYYHDIGKMRRSAYFSENQTEYNIHDTLTPRQSSRAIAAHVLQGVQMAREYHLPKPIQDGILEHHGTSLIGYFYQQARDQRKHGDVDEADYRYPGPKPQSPETAILMICDACESGVRSIKHPNKERVREFIDKIIAGHFADRQFDECDLTLRQLNTIAEVLTSRILTSLHTRVAYPDVKSERSPDNVIKLKGGGE